MSRNHKTINDLDISRDDLQQWAQSTNCDMPVATAIHALAADSPIDRTPDTIWAAPSQAEQDWVDMAVQEYVIHGDYPMQPDGRYRWGQEAVDLGSRYAVTASRGNWVNGLTEREYNKVETLEEALCDDFSTAERLYDDWRQGQYADYNVSLTDTWLGMVLGNQDPPDDQV